MGAALHSFWLGLRQTLRAIAADKGVILLLVIAPVIYGFFYPWPYATEVVQRVPTAMVDLDHSSLSRQIVRFAQASPRMQVQRLDSEAEAQQALWQGRIEGYAVLPVDLKRKALLGRPAVVTIAGNGGYALLNKSVLYGFAEAVGAVSAGIELRQLEARGAPHAVADVLRNPVNLQLVAAFNVTEGYGSSIVPAVALLILQQTLLMAAGMLVATWVEMEGEARARGATGAGSALATNAPVRVPAGVWAGRVLALALPNMLLGCFYFGWVYIWQGYPHGGNVPGALVLLPLFSLCVASLGCLLGLWLRNRERVLQVLLFSALPLFFLSGHAWPASALPFALDWLRWLTPSTASVHAAVLLNQMGATLHDVAHDLLMLLALGGAAFFCVTWAGGPRHR